MLKSDKRDDSISLEKITNNMSKDTCKEEETVQKLVPQ